MLSDGLSGINKSIELMYDTYHGQIDKFGSEKMGYVQAVNEYFNRLKLYGVDVDFELPKDEFLDKYIIIEGKKTKDYLKKKKRFWLW